MRPRARQTGVLEDAQTVICPLALDQVHHGLPDPNLLASVRTMLRKCNVASRNSVMPRGASRNRPSAMRASSRNAPETRSENDQTAKLRPGVNRKNRHDVCARRNHVAARKLNAASARLVNNNSANSGNSSSVNSVNNNNGSSENNNNANSGNSNSASSVKNNNGSSVNNSSGRNVNSSKGNSVIRSVPVRSSVPVRIRLRRPDEPPKERLKINPDGIRPVLVACLPMEARHYPPVGLHPDPAAAKSRHGHPSRPIEINLVHQRGEISSR